MINLELKVPPVIQVGLTAAGMLAVWFLFPELNAPSRIMSVVGCGLFIIGVTVALLGVLAFRKANTTVDPRFPDKSSQLVVTGVYRISRNPMYLGFLFMLIGFAFFLMSYLAFVFLPLFVAYMNRFQILPEERYMHQKFAEVFTAYAASVRRWI